MKRSVLVILVLAVVACTPLDQSRQQALDRSEQRSPYVAQNDVEFNNYDARQRIADDPATLLWCTATFPVTGAPLFTVPVIGKLTSGSKRPYPDSSADVIGPDGMYGSSVPYRYGFTPEGIYVDFTDIPTFCTTSPMVWQKETTEIVLTVDDPLLAAQVEAQAALRAGNAAEAQRILEAAVLKAQP